MKLELKEWLKRCKPFGYDGVTISFTVFNSPKEAIEQTGCKLENIWSFGNADEGGYCLNNEITFGNNLGYVVAKRTIHKNNVSVVFDKWG